jgi:hypothetical protein
VLHDPSALPTENSRLNLENANGSPRLFESLLPFTVQDGLRSHTSRRSITRYGRQTSACHYFADSRVENNV